MIDAFSQLALFAQDGPGGFGWMGMVTIWLPIGVVFYFLLIRPQRLEQHKRQAMLDAVKKNDRVVTIGGIYGVVANVQRESDEITLRVDEGNNTRIRVTMGAIARVMREEAEEAKAK
ncbi:MAG: preprotein translocase subunit YajC [Patescibacteria group bacterium]|nr:preprotein translocase subunit YajC [Patescibacteria group bacterium]